MGDVVNRIVMLSSAKHPAKRGYRPAGHRSFAALRMTRRGMEVSRGLSIKFRSETKEPSFYRIVMLSSAKHLAEPRPGCAGHRSFVALRMTRRRGLEASRACPESNVEGLEPSLP